MEKSDWVCQATLGRPRLRAPLRNARSLEKLRALVVQAMEVLCV